MVAKITLFEPHFDGAQFGPSAVGCDAADETDELPEHTNKTQSGNPAAKTRSLRRPPLRMLLALGLIFGGVAGGVLTRRGMQRGTAVSSETEAEPTIEPRAAEDLAAD